jgi:hypothetical protein
MTCKGNTHDTPPRHHPMTPRAFRAKCQGYMSGVSRTLTPDTEEGEKVGVRPSVAKLAAKVPPRTTENGTGAAQREPPPRRSLRGDCQPTGAMNAPERPFCQFAGRLHDEALPSSLPNLAARVSKWDD